MANPTLFFLLLISPIDLESLTEAKDANTKSMPSIFLYSLFFTRYCVCFRVQSMTSQTPVLR